MSETMTAREVQTRDLVTYCGETFRVKGKMYDPASTLFRFATDKGVQYVDGDREVQVVRQPAPDPKPFKVYTRLYKESGDCEKRIHEFPSEKARSAFLRRTNRVVTFVN